MKNKNDSKAILETLARLISEDFETDQTPPNYESEKADMARFYGEHPECFQRLKKVGADTSMYILPICNRAGLQDKNVMDFSIKVVRSLIANKEDGFDVNELNNTLNIIQHQKNTLGATVGAQAVQSHQFAQKVVSRALSYFDIKN